MERLAIIPYRPHIEFIMGQLDRPLKLPDTRKQTNKQKTTTTHTDRKTNTTRCAPYDWVC